MINNGLLVERRARYRIQNVHKFVNMSGNINVVSISYTLHNCKPEKNLVISDSNLFNPPEVSVIN